MIRLNDFDQFTEWLDNLTKYPKLMEKIELMAYFYKDFDLYYNRFGEKLIQNVHKKLDPEITNKLVEIRKGWNQLFSEDVLSILDCVLCKIESLWPGIGNDYLQRSNKCQYKRQLNAKRKARNEKFTILLKQLNQIDIQSLSGLKNVNICPINMKSLEQENFYESNAMISLQNQFKFSSKQMSHLSIDVSKNPSQEPFQNTQNMVMPLYSHNNQCQQCQMRRIDHKSLVKSNKIQKQQNTQKFSGKPVHLNNQIDSYLPILPKYISANKPLSTRNIGENITNDHTNQQNNNMFSPKTKSKFYRPTEILPNTSRICISGPAFDLFPEDSNETDTNPYSLHKDSDYSFTNEDTHLYEEYVPESDNDSFVPEYIPKEHHDLEDKNDLDNYSLLTFSKFNEKAAKKLYQGSPCAICYKRFQIINETEFQKHLDFHFKKSKTMHIVRKYAPHYSRWIEKANGKDYRVPLKSHEIKKEHTLQVFDDYNRNKCGICNDRFDVQFDKGEDCYMLQNAVMFNDNPYHPICINMI